MNAGGPVTMPGDGDTIAYSCPDPGYKIRLTNETTGAFVDGSATRYVFYPCELCLPTCRGSWSAYNLPLSPDTNHVTVKAWIAGALVDEDFMDVRRMPAPAGSWQTTSTINAPAARDSHSAVWDGSQMIIWGGYNGSNALATGGRYNPLNDTWSATATTNAPAARYGHTAVWTGSEMLVWGGWDGINYLATGGRYNPANNVWSEMVTANAPAARNGHTAVWTGSELIIWGGFDGTSYLATGGRYNPVANTWIAISTIGAPSPRARHTAVWSGSEMIVWGGTASASVSAGIDTGARYNPLTDTWTAISASDTPSARYNHSAVWTGSQMIVWGGNGTPPYIADSVNTGGRYDLVMNSWTATWSIGLPNASSAHTAVWNGTEMINWGGIYNIGNRYNPVTDAWTAMSINGALTEIHGHSAVWTGAEMIEWGGYGKGGYPDPGAYLDTGGRYTP